MIFIWISILLLTACFGPGLNDWQYELPNDYEIWHVNSHSIVCGKKDTDNSLSKAVDAYIAEFCYNNQFVGLKCIDVPENWDGRIDGMEQEYYLIDTKIDGIYGPFSEKEYFEEVESNDVSDLSEWIKTKPSPSGCKFPGETG